MPDTSDIPPGGSETKTAVSQAAAPAAGVPFSSDGAQNSGEKSKPRPDLAPLRAALAPHLKAAIIFSIFLNVLVLTVPIYMMQVYDRVLPSASIQTLILLSCGAVVSLLCFAALDAVRAGIMQRAGYTFHKDLTPRVLSALLSAARAPGRNAAAQPLRDVDTVRMFATSPGATAFMDAPWTIIFLAALFMLHPIFFVIGVLGMVVMLLVTLANEKATRDLVLKSGEASIAANEFAASSLRNADAVQAMGMTPALVNRWTGMARQANTTGLQATDREARFTAATRFSRLAVQMSAIGIGAALVLNNMTSPGAIFASSILISRAMQPVEMAIGSWKVFIGARGAWARVIDLLDAAKKELDDGEPLRLPAVKGRIDVENVGFVPAPQQPPTLRGVSFSMEPGDAVGIIGPTGAGKSTLTRIITGVWPPVAGSVRIDGAELKHWPVDQIGSAMGYMPQDVELFAGTVAENIARMGAVDDEQVVAAAQKAGAHDMILQFPDAYQTQIGASGTALSGGQRQRIALARALYGDPRIVVLDEPNANLDAAGDAALQRAMAQLRREKVTLIIISHRPKAMASVDKLLVLAAGKVEHFGDKDEVMKKVTRPVEAVKKAPVPAGGAKAGRASK